VSDTTLPYATATERPPGDPLGGAVGPFRLLRLLGEGGYGLVYEAEQQEPVQRRVALKLIKFGMGSIEVIRRFEAERQTLALMDHPHIASVLDAGCHVDGRPWFAMELVDGLPLHLYCERQRLPLRERLALYARVCEAVQHAHGKGVIHRDLKPSNLLVATVDGRPHPKVIDFGIAKATYGRLAEDSERTAQGLLLGTPAYMSPEQAEGSADIDVRSDVYALGVVLFQLLTGTTPLLKEQLQRTSDAELLGLIKSGEAPAPSARLRADPEHLARAAAACASAPEGLLRQVRGELDWIVLKATARERERRYDTAAALAGDVRRVLDGEPVLAAPPSLRYRLGKALRRHRALVGATAAVMLALVAGLLGFAWQARVAREKALQLEQLLAFQESVFRQIDPARLGRQLTEDVQAAIGSSPVLPALPSEQQARRRAEFDELWHAAQPADRALDLIDRTLLQPAAEAAEDGLGEQPVLLAAMRQTLADRYQQYGRFEKALALQELVLAGRREALGADHPDTLTSLSGTGVLLRFLGRLQEAEPYFRDALERRRRVLGPTHPDTLESMNLVANLLGSQGHFIEAETLYREVLELRRRMLGAEHIDTLVSQNNLGFIYRAQGRLDEATPLWIDALTRRRRTLGNEHPQTLFSITAMADLELARRQTDAAAAYIAEVSRVAPQVLGSEHPTTLTARYWRANLARQRGQLAAALDEHREVWALRVRVLGAQHPSTLASLSAVGEVQLAFGQLVEAEATLREAVQQRARLLVPQHPALLESRIALGATLRRQQQPAAALAMLRPIEAAARAQTHANRWLLGRWLEELGRAESALAGDEADRHHAEARRSEARRLLDVAPDPWVGPDTAKPD
jgi:tetratricopeptide (TPR) repeat protein